MAVSGVPMIKFYTLIALILGADGALLTFLAYAYHAKRFERFRISMKESMKVPGPERLLNIAFIAVLSLMAVFGMTYAIYKYTFHDGPVVAWRMVYEIFAILLV